MTTLDASDRAATPAAELQLGRRSLAPAIPAALAFGTTIGLSAFLLFSVEPLIGRLVLPVFGGAGGVWATVLAFFQGVLLLGYLYAHVSATRLSVRTGAVLHLVLAVVAVAATATAPQRVASLRLDGVPTLLNLVAMLAVIIGPAAFVLTATTPLMSSWYARVRRAADASASEADPYWLYALSNGGSFVALLAYPFIVEQTIGLSTQRTVWFGGFIAFVLALTVAAVKYAGTVRTVRVDAAAGAVRTTLTRDRRLRWLLLSAVPAGLLSAVTNFVTTDLISAPLLWVVPLAVYLASFVVAFSASGRARIVPIAIALAPAVLTLMWVPLGSAAGWPIVPLLVIEYLGLGILAVALHGRLAMDRPAADHLTDFYLTMSTGGVIGGAFVAVIAPLAFDGVWEYPLLLVGAAVALAIRLEGDSASATGPRGRPLRRLLRGSPMRLVPFALVAAVLVWSMAARAVAGVGGGLALAGPRRAGPPGGRRALVLRGDDGARAHPGHVHPAAGAGVPRSKLLRRRGGPARSGGHRPDARHDRSRGRMERPVDAPRSGHVLLRVRSRRRRVPGAPGGRSVGRGHPRRRAGRGIARLVHDRPATA